MFRCNPDGPSIADFNPRKGKGEAKTVPTLFKAAVKLWLKGEGHNRNSGHFGDQKNSLLGNLRRPPWPIHRNGSGVTPFEQSSKGDHGPTPSPGGTSPHRRVPDFFQQTGNEGAILGLAGQIDVGNAVAKRHIGEDIPVPDSKYIVASRGRFDNALQNLGIDHLEAITQAQQSDQAI